MMETFSKLANARNARHFQIANISVRVVNALMGKYKISETAHYLNDKIESKYRNQNSDDGTLKAYR